MPNFKTSPQSQPISESDKASVENLIQEIDPIIRKYGFDYYMMTLHNPNASKGKLLSTAVATDNTQEATEMLADAFRTVQELINTQRPTAPGGIA